MKTSVSFSKRAAKRKGKDRIRKLDRLKSKCFKTQSELKLPTLLPEKASDMFASSVEENTDPSRVQLLIALQDKA